MARRSLLERRATAYHEAGHGVACVVQGLTVNKLSIVPDDGTLGHCLHPSMFGYEVGTNRERRSIARDVILVSYAGWAAEVKFHPAAERFRSRSDDEAAFETSREFGVFPRRLSCVGNEHHWAYLERLRGEARRLIDRRWPAVVALAEVLFKRKTLNGIAVGRIVNE